MLIEPVFFNGWKCNIEKGYYSNGRTALELIDWETEEPICVATVNLPNEELEDDEIFIKDYSENEGVLSALIKAEIVSEPIKHVDSGFVKIPLCKLLI